MPDIFISLRFGESLEHGKALKEALERERLNVFLCAIPEGDNIAQAVAENLLEARLVIILGTETYGQQTDASYSTYQELVYIMQERRPFFLIKMCDRYKVKLTRFYFNATISYFDWPIVLKTVPDHLVERILAKFKTLPPPDDDDDFLGGQKPAATSSSPRADEEERARQAADEAKALQKQREEAEALERTKNEELEAIKKREERELKEKAEKDALKSHPASSDKAQSVPAFTMTVKKQKVAKAEATILSEREAWANSGKVGYLTKLEKGGLFGGKKPKSLFFMLRMIQSNLEIYPKGNSSGMTGEPKGKPSQVWKFGRSLTVLPVDDSKNPLGQYVVQLQDRNSGTLQLGCASETERQEWIAAFKRAASGFSPSKAAEEALEKAKAIVVEDDMSELSQGAQEQLAKLHSLFETGLLTKEEVEQLKVVILEQDRQVAKSEPARPRQGRAHRADLGYTFSQPNGVVCKVCSILNMHGGPNCLVCNAPLPNTDVHSSDKWLPSLNDDKGGTLRCMMNEPVSVMDQQTWSQVSLYVIQCEYSKGIQQERWTVRHGWKWFQKWHEKLASENLVYPLPAFPKVTENEEASTKSATMSKLKLLLETYMSALVAGVQDPHAFLKSELVNKLLRLSDNIGSPGEDTRAKKALQNVLDPVQVGKGPMTREELETADDAATLLLSMLKGEDNVPPASPSDPLVQDLHARCLAVVPRLRASQDVDNPLTNKDIIPAALDVFEYNEKALRAYNDAVLSGK